MKNSLKTAGATCLAAAGLVSTWDAPVKAQIPPYPPGSTPSAPISFTGEITPDENLYDVYFIFAGGPCSPAYSKLISSFIPANTTTSFNITFNSIYSWDGVNPNVGDSFTVAGLYDTVNGSVSLGFNPTQAANILGQSPVSAFSGPWTYGYYTVQAPDYVSPEQTANESDVASALESGTYLGSSLNDSSSGGIRIDPNAGNYYSQVSTDPNNPSDFSLVDFDDASSGGSGWAVEVVPEPATVSVLGFGLLSCAMLRRKLA